MNQVRIYLRDQKCYYPFVLFEIYQRDISGLSEKKKCDKRISFQWQNNFIIIWSTYFT